jgi:predicted DNA-binding ribbon-helix-helix protein
MPSLHRTQVLLEHRQYQRLKRLARQEGISLSALLRQILDASLAQSISQSKKSNLKRLAGLGHDEELSGRDHDQALYGRSA